jgi:hypothetical protein
MSSYQLLYFYQLLKRLVSLQAHYRESLVHPHQSQGLGLIAGGLQAVMHGAATDPRDKVYSIRSFIQPEEAAM